LHVVTITGTLYSTPEAATGCILMADLAPESRALCGDLTESQPVQALNFATGFAFCH